MEKAEENDGPPAATIPLGLRESALRWGAIVLAAFAGFGPALMPITGGLDSGWQLGLSWARELGLHWGSGIIFTYGPWGHITAVVPLSSALMWQAIGFQLGSLALVAWASWRLTERCGRWWAALVAIPVTTAAASSGIATALFLGIVLACVGVASEERDADRLSWILGGLAGFSVLIKFNTGTVAVAIGALAMVATVRWCHTLIRFVTSAVACLVGGWLAASQSFSDLVPWLRGSVDIAAGYPTAMRHVREDLAGWLPLAALAFGLGTSALLGAVAWYRERERPLRHRGAVTLAVCAAAAALYLASATRLDAGHLGILPCGFFVLGVPLAASLGRPGDATRGPWRRLSITLTAVAALTLVCLAVSVAVLGSSGVRHYFHPMSAFETFATELRLAESGQARAATLAAQKDAIRAAYSVPSWELRSQDPPATTIAGPSATVVEALRERTVHVEPWAISLAWAHGLTWKPMPVIQTFAAYTRRLDEVDEQFLRSPDGPSGILRQSAAIDGKCPLWESPRYQLALLCNFTEAASDGRWQALARVTDRCESSRVLGKASLRSGEPVPVPRIDGAIVIAELSSRAGESSSTRKLALVGCGSRHYRLAQGIPSGPLVVRADASGWDSRTMPAPCETLSVDRPVDVVFSAVGVRATKP